MVTTSKTVLSALRIGARGLKRQRGRQRDEHRYRQTDTDAERETGREAGRRRDTGMYSGLKAQREAGIIEVNGKVLDR